MHAIVILCVTFFATTGIFKADFMSDQPRQRILYIEDDDAMALLFKTVMEKQGYFVDLATSGEQGLAMFTADPYALVAMENDLGDMTGLEVCRELVKHDADPATILVTGKGNEAILLEALAIGVARYIPKGDDTTYTQVMPAVVKGILNRRANAQQGSLAGTELRRSEERLRQAEELSHSCHWESDQAMTGWVFASPNSEKLLGIPINVLLGNYDNFMRHVHPDDRDNLRETFRIAVRESATYETRYRFCHPDGRVIHLLGQAAPVTDDNGNVLYYHGSSRDITAQVDTEERYRAVVESAVEAIITIDSGGVIQSFNRAAETLFQYLRSEVIGLNVKILMPTEHAEKHDGYLSSYLTTGQAKIIGIGRDVDAQRKDGTMFPAFLSVSQHEIGGKTSFTGLLRDVSEQKATEESLIAAKNEAERANRAKSEFLSSMSHELRTPLNAVLGFAQMLEYNPAEPLTPTQQESVNLIKRGGSHLLTLINEVLELAKIEAGRLDLSIEVLELSRILEECASIARATASGRGISLLNAAKGKILPHIVADSTRLKQVLLNLLSNAVKYNRDAGEITIEARKTDDGFVRITVSDTGIGLSEREKRKIFEPFERLGKQSEDIEGTGIGLTITKQLVEMMSGRLGFESELGGGSTFWVDLPIADSTGDRKPKRRMDDLQRITSGPIADPDVSYSILYIEDNQANALLMKKIFAGISNVTLHVLDSGNAGVKYAKQHKPDVILMDINLPDISGVEAAKILQRKKETQGIPIIAVSASIWRTKYGVEEGVDFYRYVEKPFVVMEIRDIIQSALLGKPK